MNEKEVCNCPLCGKAFVPGDGLSADEYLAKSLLTAIKEMQNKEDNNEHSSKPLPCPRCGYIRKGETNSPLSRNEDVHICMNCAIEETVIEASGRTPLPITQWYIISDLLKVFKG